MNASQIVNKVNARAAKRLPTRMSYGRAVLAGAQNWSGSDLQGAAKSWGSSYRRARQAAADALGIEGGRVLAVDYGKLLSAVPVCTDDYGNEVYATRRGFAWPNTRAQYRVQP